ncbi:tyrosine-type recombinase/integrase [Aromatoleum toluclasticum]|uniref:tyrosine-type recombinase/integrase n=1 Tax=Aromatoleum toluclasticum TaxID=92003 RepID=UPI0003A6FA1F|nr:tyrosine-type recombinase/integrase [Aromatoleum toluclasticum]
MTDSLMVPGPFEGLRLPSDLDGSHGHNRAVGKVAQIAAINDLQAIQAWLARFADTRTTFDNYRKEAERLYLWAVFQLGRPISSLTHEDFLVYQRFLADPQPRDKWLAGAGRKHPRGDPRWRPFYGPLAPTSQRQAMVILNVMFAWLVEAGYLAGNPLSLSRHRTRRPKPRITRYLDPDLWQEVKAYIEGMPCETDRQRAHYFRIRWLFTLLYLGGLRISEVGYNTMGGFFCRRDRDGEERWWLEVLGKGEKERLVPATNEMIVELARYRRECGLAPYPTPTEDTPLVLPIGKSREPLTRAALHAIVKKVFDGAASRLRQRGEEYAARANQLERASAHWLRHTAGSHMADQQIDLRSIRDNLGHESLKTTSQYLHTDDDVRHRETEQKHRIGW